MEKDIRDSGTQSLTPTGWSQEAHTFWLEGEKNEAIQAVRSKINLSCSPYPYELGTQLAHYFRLLGNWGGAASIYSEICKAHPDKFEALLNFGICLRRSGDIQKAIEILEQAATVNNNASGIWESLATAYSKQGDYVKAKEAGERSLRLKDQQCPKPTPPWHPPESTPSEFVRSKKKQNIISFSLWGDNPRYLRGALQNVLLAPKIYPNWKCRFYVDDSVPEEFLNSLADYGVQLVIENNPENLNMRTRLARRFWVANDKNVGYFIVRDCDSVINLREAMAVDIWMNSDCWFHVMRDYWTHTALILAGMWGGVAGVLPDLESLFKDYKPNIVETPSWDRWFLRDRAWGFIASHSLVHDRCYVTGNSVPFPGGIVEDIYTVGVNEFAARRDSQEEFLKKWIDRLPCLRLP